MAVARRASTKSELVGAASPEPMIVERRLKEQRTPQADAVSKNIKRLSESLLDMVWTLVDNGVVSTDDAAPLIELLADIVDGRETK